MMLGVISQGTMSSFRKRLTVIYSVCVCAHALVTFTVCRAHGGISGKMKLKLMIKSHLSFKNSTRWVRVVLKKTPVLSVGHNANMNLPSSICPKHWMHRAKIPCTLISHIYLFLYLSAIPVILSLCESISSANACYCCCCRCTFFFYARRSSAVWRQPGCKRRRTRAKPGRVFSFSHSFVFQGICLMTGARNRDFHKTLKRLLQRGLPSNNRPLASGNKLSRATDVFQSSAWGFSQRLWVSQDHNLRG